ncbi:MAG: hypothetical protein HY584_02995 [Candidatus Omnitrophica bacterium]|nr:hypothetical protein [Candidatus Omnitrophota bacterium]
MRQRAWNLIVNSLVAFAFFMGFHFNSLFATPTGLDNIPTADTVPHRTVVIQEYTDFIDDSEPTHSLGFKSGLFDIVEFGMDRKVGPNHSGANLFQTKLKLDPVRFGAKGNWPLFTGGVANVAWTDRGREISGQPFSYLVTSYKVKFEKWNLVRAHLGFTFQNDNEGVFFGFDREIFKGFSLKTDYITVNNGRDLLSSWGFIYEPGWKFPFNIAIEAWYGVSTQAKKKNDFLLKFDYILRY